MEKWLKEAPQEQGPMRLRLFGPGAVQSLHSKLSPTELPDGVSVVITQTGKEPAKIVVKQNDKTWEITSDQLEKLPAELRGPVSQLLSGPKGAFGVELPQHFQWTSPSLPPKSLKIQPPTTLPHAQGEKTSLSNIQQEMAEMRKELEAMRKELQNRQAEREALHNALKKLLENK